MKFFNLDCHISVISDIKNILENLGHQVDSWSLSGHRWVLNLPECKSPVINADNWKNINQEMVDKFYETHRKELDKYDAFICAYPPIFLKLFEQFNKPILVISATRYDFPVAGDKNRLAWLEDSLKNNSNIIKIANNQFDQKYCENFLGNKWEWIPSLCDYTNSHYSPKSNNFLYFSKLQIELPECFVNKDSLGKYTWQDLYSYKGIVHVPYNVSTMSIFEQNQAQIPLHFPTMDFSLDLIKQGIAIFSEIVFPNPLPERQAKKFLNREWLSYSDFYNGTIKCNYFDSGFDIKNEKIPFKNKDKVYNKWIKLLGLIK